MQVTELVHKSSRGHQTHCTCFHINNNNINKIKKLNMQEGSTNTLFLVKLYSESDLPFDDTFISIIINHLTKMWKLNVTHLTSTI